MAHWHDFNPWADKIVYVPSLEELAQCCSTDIERTVERWRTNGSRLDAYILPNPSSWHSIGVRYGPKGPDYLSPYNRFNETTKSLLLKYGPKEPA